MELTAEQREDFLEFVRAGHNRQQAAEMLIKKHNDSRLTASKIRSYCFRHPDYAREYQLAIIEGRGSLVDRLERCAVEMAEGGHWPALKFLLTTYGEQFAWARSSKVEVGGSVEISSVAGILAKYLPPEDYETLLKVVEQKMLESGSEEAA